MLKTNNQGIVNQAQKLMVNTQPTCLLTGQSRYLTGTESLRTKVEANHGSSTSLFSLSIVLYRFQMISKRTYVSIKIAQDISIRLW